MCGGGAGVGGAGGRGWGGGAGGAGRVLVKAGKCPVIVIYFRIYKL